MEIKKNLIDKQEQIVNKVDVKILDILCIFMFMTLFILVGVIFACLLIIFI